VIKFLIWFVKIIIFIAVVLVIGQLEYNDRKVKTYVVEFFKSKMISSSAKKDAQRLDEGKIVTDFVNDEDKEELNKILD
jgi:maltodextrin utilization protein YvdJ